MKKLNNIPINSNIFQTIDFNNINRNEVSIHKRNREKSQTENIKTEIMSPPSSFSDNGLPKKKKYKIVPNESKPISNLTIKINSSDASHKSNVPIPIVEMSNNELPKDRKDLLNFVSFY